MGMKLVIAIVQNDDADDLIDALTTADYRATRMASTGGFLRQGNTTIMVGVPESAVSDVLSVVASHSKSRRTSVVPPPNPFPTPASINVKNKTDAPNPVEQFIGEALSAGNTPEVQTGRATVFVLNLERYERI